MKKIITLLLLSVFISCGRQEIRQPRRRIRTEPTITIPHELKITTKEKYQYTGDKYPDPFTDTIVREPIKDTTLKQALSPDLQSLKINGVIRDKNSIYILLESPIGNYIIKEKKMYDINLKPVMDVEIDFKKSILVLQKGNEIRKIDLSSWVGGDG